MGSAVFTFHFRIEGVSIMTFGRDLKAEFSRLWHKKEPTNEIPLFRILCEAILSQKLILHALPDKSGLL